MLTYTMQQFATCIACEGDTGMLIAANGLDENGTEENAALARLLRLYVEIQTNVRMSLPISPATADEFKALNSKFNPTETYLAYGSAYHDQLGPFYTRLAADIQLIADHMNLLEEQPVRKLELQNVVLTDDNLAFILRNHRMEYMTHLTIRFRYGQRRLSAEAARAIVNFKGSSMMRVDIAGIDDPLNLIKVMFKANRTVRKGCELFIRGKHVTTK